MQVILWLSLQQQWLIFLDDTWIWHAFFGMPGTLNDINVLNCSPFLVKVVCGEFAVPPYVLNRTQRTNAYFLADGIYPQLPCLVKTIAQPCTASQQYFAQWQDGARKDVERTFALLQRRFWILSQSSRFWFKGKMHVIITCCIILHNMILEDEREVLSEEEKQYFLEYDQILTEPLSLTPNQGIIIWPWWTKFRWWDFMIQPSIFLCSTIWVCTFGIIETINSHLLCSQKIQKRNNNSNNSKTQIIVKIYKPRKIKHNIHHFCFFYNIQYREYVIHRL